MSLAVVQSSDTSATILTGINSSTADQQAGKNEHLRSFMLEYPRLKKIAGSNEEGRVASTEGRVQTKALGKASLFTPATGTKKETYQRVLRLSRTHITNGTRLGVIATGLAQEGEVIVFTIDSPDHVDVRRRIQLTKGQEAADIDLILQESGDFLVTYCTDYEVYIFKISADPKSTDSNGQLVHATPMVTNSGKRRPTFRSIRFLTSKLILLLQNQPNRTGAELLLLEVPEGNDRGLIILRKVLHKAIKSASALSTALLAPSNPTQKAQHVIAIAGQDISITLLTLEHSLNHASLRNLKFRTHTTLYNVHPLQMTALTFSIFLPPSDPSNAPPQYLKLASTSMSSTVIVHTFPLSPYPSPPSKRNADVRYVLKPPGAGETAQMSFSIVVSIIVVALGAFLLQAWTEIRGGTPDYLGAKGWLSQRVHDYIALPYMFEDVHIDMPVIPTRLPKIEQVKGKVPSAQDIGNAIHESAETVVEKAEALGNGVKRRPSLRQLLSQWHATRAADDDDGDHDPEDDEDDEDEDDDDEDRDVDEDGDDDEDHEDEGISSVNPEQASAPRSRNFKKGRILLRPHPSSSAFSAALHPKAHEEGKLWDELSHEQKERWKERLIKAGEWTVEEGEAVLKGVFFGQLGGLVGAVVGGL